LLHEALVSYEQAIKSKPTFADAHNNRGAAILSLGRFQEGIASVLEALRLKPGFPMAYHQLGRLARDGKYSMSEAETNSIRQALACKQSPRNNSLLHFALAYTLERQAAYDEAFEHYVKANSLKRQAPDSPAFDMAAHQRQVNWIIATFDR